jgi:uncharacterized secreted protein with C-terminal beta-propeller domain
MAVLHRRALMSVLIASGLGVAGCTGSGGANPAPGRSAERPATARLVAYSDCTELLDGLRKATAAQVGQYGLSGGYPIRRPVDGVDGAESRAAVPGAAPGAAQPAQAPDHSTTNVHEAGVDEPDVVKTDGRRIIAVSRGRLFVVDAASHKVTGTLDLPERTRGISQADLLLHGDRVLIVAPQPMIMPLLEERGPVPPRTPKSRLILVDISGAPRVVSELTANGVYVDARQVGQVARVVVRSAPRIEFPTPDPGAPRSGTDRNRESVQKTPLDAWLPSYEVSRGGRTQTVRVPCERVSHPPKYAGTSMLSVLTLDLTGDLSQADPVSVVAGGQTVYGTASSLYVTDAPGIRPIPIQGRPAQQDATSQTEIYKFDIRGNGRPRYAASGSVPGSLLNQYSLSEYGGNLRVATTTDPIAPAPPLPEGSPQSGPAQSTPVSRSAVRVLAQRGERLVQVGELDGLGKGERIFAVRFIGPSAYVVTFRRVDPLYVVDLRDPSHPKASGELKINGYSAYLHPAGDGMLIGVGQDATGEGQATGTQVSLFDVRDPANPRRLSAYKVGEGSSEAEFDPHAFLYWPASGLTVLPVSRSAAGEALVLSVRAGKVSRLGAVNQPGQYPNIRRALIIGGTLWTMSDAGVQASDATTLSDQAWVGFS